MNSEEIIALLHSMCHSDPKTKGGEYCLTEHEILAFAHAIQDKQLEEDAKICDMRYMHTENSESRRCADTIRANKE